MIQKILLEVALFIAKQKIYNLVEKAVFQKLSYEAFLEQFEKLNEKYLKIKEKYDNWNIR